MVPVMFVVIKPLCNLENKRMEMEINIDNVLLFLEQLI